MQTLKSHIFFYLISFCSSTFLFNRFYFYCSIFYFLYNFLLLRFNSLDHNLINALCFSRGFRLEPWICYPSQSYLLCSSLKKFFEILRFQNRKSHEILFLAKPLFLYKTNSKWCYSKLMTLIVSLEKNRMRKVLLLASTSLPTSLKS